jgi:ABC-type uncharacterized transport system permease subunit
MAASGIGKIIVGLAEVIYSSSFIHNNIDIIISIVFVVIG